MNTDRLREICLSFPGVTEQVQWGYDLVFKVGGKMFAVTALEPSAVFLSFKASDESFAELTERPSVIPAPYLARAKWVALQTKDALPSHELESLLRASYDLVLAKLPQKLQQSLANPGVSRKAASPRSLRKSKARGKNSVRRKKR